MISLSSLKCGTLILRNTNKTLTFNSNDILLSSYIKKKSFSFSFLGLKSEEIVIPLKIINMHIISHVIRQYFSGKK